jgi:hypothetical protein
MNKAISQSLTASSWSKRPPTEAATNIPLALIALFLWLQALIFGGVPGTNFIEHTFGLGLALTGFVHGLCAGGYKAHGDNQGGGKDENLSHGIFSLELAPAYSIFFLGPSVKIGQLRLSRARGYPIFRRKALAHQNAIAPVGYRQKNHACENVAALFIDDIYARCYIFGVDYFIGS